MIITLLAKKTEITNCGPLDLLTFIELQIYYAFNV